MIKDHSENFLKGKRKRLLIDANSRSRSKISYGGADSQNEKIFFNTYFTNVKKFS
jgi:hypothetical protein